jgi:hypothetical protein
MGGFDPTGTTGLRARFRSAAQIRLRLLIADTRKVLVHQDMVALSGHGDLAAFLPRVPLDQGQKLDMFAEWFTSAAYQHVVGNGEWIKEWLARAYDSGVLEAERMTARPVIQPTLSPLYVSATRRELEGIADALIQQVSRAVTGGIARKAKPAMLWRDIIRIFRTVGGARLRWMANTVTVQLHNVGRLDLFAAVGVEKVGVHPEGRKLPVLTKDADEEDFVNVLTAGDQDVCQECEDIAAGGPYTLDEAFDLIPAHPDCRCAFVPAFDMRFAINKLLEMVADPEAALEEEL